MKIIYLASNGVSLETDYDVKYNDIVEQEGIDIAGDMMGVDLGDFDFLIATPPCNYWSRANYRRETSKYAQATKHLLPNIIEKFIGTGKPYIIENVINKPLMARNFDYGKDRLNYYEIGRHSYFTNLELDDELIDYLQSLQVKDDVQNITGSKRQGGYNVNIVFEEVIDKYGKGEIKIRKEE